MKCETIRELFSSYIDDQLGDDDRRQVEEHLASCPDCAQEMALLRRTVALAASLEQVELPEGFHASLTARLAQADAETRAEASAAESVRSAVRPFSKQSSVAQGVFGRIRDAMRRPAWRGALATAATVILVFAVVNQALPGWNGNVWSLLNRSRTYLSSREPGVTGTSTEGQGAGTTKFPGGVVGGAGTTTPDSDASKGGGSVPGGIAATGEGSNLLDIRSGGLDGSQVIKTANVTVEVKDFVAAEGQVLSIVGGKGGYVEQSSLSLGEKAKSGWWRIRVPQDKFDETIALFAALGTVKGKDMGAEDVAGTIVDIQARIANLRRQELRLGELLGQAKTLDEILRVENELNRVRYQVESYEGQLKWLQNRVAMATIQLNLTEPGDPVTPPVPGADLWRQIWAAFVATWRGIGRFLGGLVVFIASVAPVALILAAAWVAYRRWRAAKATGK